MPKYRAPELVKMPGPPPAPPVKPPWERKYRDGRKVTPHGRSIYVSVMAQEYLAGHRFNELSDKTKQSYKSALHKFEQLILFNGKHIFQCRATDVNHTFIDYLARVLSHTHTPASIKFRFAVMSSIWELGIRHGHVWFNPWAKCGIKVDNDRDLTWSREDVYKAISKAKEMGFELLALYILFSYTFGIRPWSDLRELQWSNIIDQDGIKVISFKIAKTDTNLMVPMTKETIEALQQHPKSSNYIFVTKDGKRLCGEWICKQFERVKIEAGLNTDYQFRDLRRTMVTELAIAGASEAEITSLTGWKCPAKVVNRYARVRLKTANNAMNRLQGLRNEPENSGICAEVILEQGAEQAV